MRYEFHRELFHLLGLETVAEHFASIWELCEPHMGDDPHKSTAQGMTPEDFLEGLWEILLEEARRDERRGRKVLAERIRAAADVIEVCPTRPIVVQG